MHVCVYLWMYDCISEKFILIHQHYYCTFELAGAQRYNAATNNFSSLCAF